MMNSNTDVQFIDHFVKALAEEGLGDASVSHSYDQNRLSHLFKVKLRDVDGVPTRTTSISERELSMSNDNQQVIAMQAQQIARAIKDEVTDLQEWGEKVVELDVTRKEKATCLRCGESITMDDMERGSGFINETTVPNQPIQSGRSLSDIKKKLILIAMLRDQCEPHCPNSPHDPIAHRNI